MMYHLKKIIVHDDEITLPKCMYFLKNPNESMKADEIDINISDQVIKFLKTPSKKMIELEHRQDQLLKKLDILYDRIKTISSICDLSPTHKSKTSNIKQGITTSDEIVMVLSPDNLPWFLNIILKESSLAVNFKWHIHSSVPTEKVAKIKAFVKKMHNAGNYSKICLRLIFKCVSADSELKLSSLAVPIVGNVNILRYLAFVYPNIIPYEHEDFNVDRLLDICHLLERTPEKNKEAVIQKLFAQYDNWIHNNEFSIVDIAAHNVVKQWQNGSKFVPKSWFDKCEKICL